VIRKIVANLGEIMVFKYNALDQLCKSPFGAMKNGEKLCINLKSDAQRVYIHGFGKKQQMKKNGENFCFDFEIEKDIGIYYYKFEAVSGKKSRFYGRGAFAKSIAGGKDYQITVHANQLVPKWFKGATMYQIYVDRFFKGDDRECQMRDNVLMHSSWDDKPLYVRKKSGEIMAWDFFGGNIDGVIKKLKYIKDLGVDIIYLNPIFEASSNHKYDTADYTKVDRMYGREDTLKRLVDEAGKMDIKIMLDGVFSHTGDDSIYFNRFKTYGDTVGAYNDKNSPYYSWYDFEKHPEKYDCWWGVKALPCVNELAPSFMNYLLNENDGAVTQWMRLGIAGWRLDVADELPDRFISELKKCVLKVNPQAVLLGEVWEDASNKVSYDHPREYILGDSLDSVSNYPLRDGLIAVLKNEVGPAEFGDKMMQLYENYPRDIFYSLMNMTGTHDTTRLFTLLGGAPEKETMDTWECRQYQLSDVAVKTAKQKLYLYFLALYTLPGNPCIYYGDEICLQGYEDPYNRGTFDWDSGEKAMVAFIKRLLKLRKQLDINASNVMFENNNDRLGYNITSANNRYYVCINPYDIEITVDIAYNRVEFSHNCDESQEKIALHVGGAVVVSLS
jgi:glycosidase